MKIENDIRPRMCSFDRFETINGIRMHFVEAGPKDGHSVILLHGFPEYWYGWRQQIPALAEAGYHVVAPDMRGYNLSEKPKGIEHYTIPHLVNDTEALIRYIGKDKVSLVGHDWGGVVSWYTAQQKPEYIDKLVVLNAPHPNIYRRNLLRSSQIARSSYVAFFQVPHIPEFLLKWHDYALIRRVFAQEPTRADAFTTEDIAQYKTAYDQEGSLTAMVNYYRGLRYKNARQFPDTEIAIPTLLLWGDKDIHLVPSLGDLSNSRVLNHQVIHFPHAGHFLQHDAPEDVNQAIIQFIA